MISEADARATRLEQLMCDLVDEQDWSKEYKRRIKHDVRKLWENGYRAGCDARTPTRHEMGG